MIHKIEIEGETIHLNKSKIFGWSIVHPLKKEDGTKDWFNIITGGSIWKLLFIIVLFLLILVAVQEYKSNMETCSKAVDIVNRFQLWDSTNVEFNWSQINIDIPYEIGE
jgi:hypothetical protein